MMIGSAIIRHNLSIQTNYDCGYIKRLPMYSIDLSGKTGLIVGVANENSIAWAIAKILAHAGVRLAFSYQNERLEAKVRALAEQLDDAIIVPCDVLEDHQIWTMYEEIKERLGHLDFLIHSVAFAPREALQGLYLDTRREDYLRALEVSSYSLIALAKHAVPLMTDGGSILALTYIASQRAVPRYNVMGTAKAALEQAVRQLAMELGPNGIRVNAISAGPVQTLAARGIQGFLSMYQAHREKAPLQRSIDKNEIATTALFLCSDMSSGITGSTVYVDAGYHIML